MGNASQQSVSVGNGEPFRHQQELDVIGPPAVNPAIETRWNTVRPSTAAVRAGHTRCLYEPPGFRLIHVRVRSHSKKPGASSGPLL